MTIEPNYPPEQRKLLVDHLIRDIRLTADESGIDVEAAFLKLATSNLGYETDKGFQTDGSGDFGFDYLEVSEREAFVFQSKSIDQAALIDYDGNNVFSPEKIVDLHRIISVLENLGSIPESVNGNLKKGLEELRVQVSRAGRSVDGDEKSLTEADNGAPPYSVTIVFVALAHRLTTQAMDEFQKITTRKSVAFGNIEIGLRYQLKLIDDIISERWRKENEQWRDKSGKKRERVRLTICDNQVLRPGQSYVFFTRAIDLVRAYEDFGYQIFEPNVRAEIHNSPVNKEIKRSISSRKGRIEFRHLNNGITIVAGTISNVGPKDKLTALDVERPGIVNGLQTVKSLHDGYKELSDAREQAHFESDCSVLCRVHGVASVSDPNLLIKSTNNQNAMKPRNLRSNDPEQLIYEQLFAELNWFYQRKEGAWRAFKGSHKGWPRLGGRQSRDFKSGKAERIADNEEIAQNWLCFIGFSKEAINERRAIFSPERDDLYRVCFLLTPDKHGYHHSYRIKDAEAAAAKESPSAGALLLSQLARELYEFLVPGPKVARAEAIARLNLKEDLPKEELETKLVSDDRYMTTRVMNGTKTLFVEFFGFIMLEVWGRKLQSMAPDLMQRGAFKELFRNHRFEPAKEVVDRDAYTSEEALLAIYKLYEYCIFRLVTDPGWKRQYDAALVKSRFLYEEKNRQRLIEELVTVDQLIARRGVSQPWSDMFDEAKGVFAFFKSWMPNVR